MGLRQGYGARESSSWVDAVQLSGLPICRLVGRRQHKEKPPAGLNMCLHEKQLFLPMQEWRVGKYELLQTRKETERCHSSAK